MEGVLLDSSGQPVTGPAFRSFVQVEEGSFVTTQLLASVANPRKWSAEHPNLYTLVLSLRGQDGTLLQAVSRRSASASSRSKAISCC